MKIKYESVTKEVTEIEVSDEIGEIILDSRRKEKAGDEQQRIHCPYHFSFLDFEGKEYATTDSPEGQAIKTERIKKINAAFDALTEIQKRRITLLSEGKSLREISRVENVDIKTVRESIEAARKKFLKNF